VPFIPIQPAVRLTLKSRAGESCILTPDASIILNYRSPSPSSRDRQTHYLYRSDGRRKPLPPPAATAWRLAPFFTQPLPFMDCHLVLELSERDCEPPAASTPPLFNNLLDFIICHSCPFKFLIPSRLLHTPFFTAVRMPVHSFLPLAACLLYGQSVIAQSFDALAALSALGVNVTYPPPSASYAKANAASTSSSSSQSSLGCSFSVSRI
jgi:hypothetical protein